MEAYPSLQAAIDVAQPGDCIWVAAGRYFPDPAGMTDRTKSFRIQKKLTLLGGFSGDETCLGQRAGLFAGTRLSGEIGNQAITTDNSYRVVHAGTDSLVVGEPQDIVLDGFNIQRAYNDSSAPQGGGIFCDIGLSSLQLRNCIVRDNWAVEGGGLWGAALVLDIVRCKFIMNEASSQGGAMWIEGAMSSHVTHQGTPLGPLVFNSTFKDNEANQGGGVFLTGFQNAERMTFVNCLMHHNLAAQGGFAYLTERILPNYSNPGLARFYNCTLSDNTATSTLGSAVYIENNLGLKPGKANFLNSIVYGNNPSAAAIYEQGGAYGTSTQAFFSIVDTNNPLDCNPVPDCVNDTTGPLYCTTWDCDPLLAADFTLQMGSSAVDSGDLTLTLVTTGEPEILDYVDLDGDGTTAEPLPLDLADNPREKPGTLVDRGAYEVQ